MELLVVAYHYIDSETKYKAGIYPTSPERFRNQLQTINKTHKFITEENLVNAIKGKEKLPEKSCLITFDDAVISQYDIALPILEELSVPAVIFVPTAHFSGNSYRVNKIHYLLSQLDPKVLLTDVENVHHEIFGQYPDWEKIGIEKISNWYRYDVLDVAKFKYLLNHVMKSNTANKIISKVFEKNYPKTEEEFCKKTFMGKDHIEKLKSHKLISLGLHTHSHESIPNSTKEEVSKDLHKNYNYLKNDLEVEKINGISYPYGLITKETFEKQIEKSVNELGLTYGFTTEKNINTNLDNPFLLCRYGANDITGGKRPIYNIE